MKKEITLFDKRRNVNRLLAAFYSLCFILLIVDLFVGKHPDFPWEGYPNFYAVYGFLCCVMLIFAAKILRIFIKRDENYYD